MAVLYYESELTHHGVPKQKWYRHQFGDWEEHARYANGQPDPNGRGDKKPYKEAKKTTSSSNTSSSVVSKASGVVKQFMVRQKKKAAAAKQRQYKKDLQERLAAATSSPEEMARFKKTATDAELRALQKRLDVYKALNKATPDALKKKEETPEERNKRIADLANSYPSGYVDEKELSKEDREAMYDYMARENAKSREQKQKQAESEKPEEHGSASNLLSNVITSNMKDELAEKAFHNLFKITKPSFSSQVARDKKLQKKLIKACESPKNLAAFKKAATNAELKALEERLRIIERTNKAIPDRLKSEADVKAAKAARKKSREDMSAAELKDLYERAVYLDQIERLERRKTADKAESIMNVVKYGPAIATAIDSGSTLLRAAYRLKSNKDVVDKINKGEQKEKGVAWTYKDIDAENARVLMGAVGDELGVLWKTWQNYNGGGGGNQQGNKKDKNKGNPQQTTDQSNNDKDKDNND